MVATQVTHAPRAWPQIEMSSSQKYPDPTNVSSRQISTDHPDALSGAVSAETAQGEDNRLIRCASA
jgi:hypothetical protein